MLRISVVTPSFNQADFIEATINSILGQNYPSLEYVVIDGGSSDSSASIVERHARDLHYWVSEKDGGIANALNKGFRQTSGDIMAWLNSDDLYHPWTFATVNEIFSAFPEVEWITGLPVQWDKSGRISQLIGEYPRNKFDYLTGNYQWLQQESIFWRRSLWDRTGGQIDETMTLAIDTELWTRFFDTADLFHVECVLGGWRQWGGNRSITQTDRLHAEVRTCLARMEARQNAPTMDLAKRLRFRLSVPQSRFGVAWRHILWKLHPDGQIKGATGYKAIVQDENGWRIEDRPRQF
jgi:hypothetical protein